MLFYFWVLCLQILPTADGNFHPGWLNLQMQNQVYRGLLDMPFIYGTWASVYFGVCELSELVSWGYQGMTVYGDPMYLIWIFFYLVFSTLKCYQYCISSVVWSSH